MKGWSNWLKRKCFPFVTISLFTNLNKWNVVEDLYTKQTIIRKMDEIFVVFVACLFYLLRYYYLFIFYRKRTKIVFINFRRACDKNKN